MTKQQQFALHLTAKKAYETGQRARETAFEKAFPPGSVTKAHREHEAAVAGGEWDDPMDVFFGHEPDPM